MLQDFVATTTVWSLSGLVLKLVLHKKHHFRSILELENIARVLCFWRNLDGYFEGFQKWRTFKSPQFPGNEMFVQLFHVKNLPWYFWLNLIATSHNCKPPSKRNRFSKFTEFWKPFKIQSSCWYKDYFPPTKTDILAENWWLEDEISFWNDRFSGLALSITEKPMPWFDSDLVVRNEMVPFFFWGGTGHSFIFGVGHSLKISSLLQYPPEDSDSWRFLGPKADPWEFLAKTNFCVDYKMLGGLPGYPPWN